LLGSRVKISERALVKCYFFRLAGASSSLDGLPAVKSVRPCPSLPCCFDLSLFILPPRSMPSRLLTAMFRVTWLSCPKSARMELLMGGWRRDGKFPRWRPPAKPHPLFGDHAEMPLDGAPSHLQLICACRCHSQPVPMRRISEDGTRRDIFDGMRVARVSDGTTPPVDAFLSNKLGGER
jgi:hypothetical protein